MTKKTTTYESGQYRLNLSGVDYITEKKEKGRYLISEENAQYPISLRGSYVRYMFWDPPMYLFVLDPLSKPCVVDWPVFVKVKCKWRKEKR